MPTGILILSPHMDDAALSLSHALARWTAHLTPLTVINFFTRSEFAPFSAARGVDKITRLRASEDAQFFANFPTITRQDFALADAPIRLRISPADVRTPGPPSPPDQRLCA